MSSSTSATIDGLSPARASPNHPASRLATRSKLRRGRGGGCAVQTVGRSWQVETALRRQARAVHDGLRRFSMSAAERSLRAWK